jgi:hypothetical protein
MENRAHVCNPPTETVSAVEDASEKGMKGMDVISLAEVPVDLVNPFEKYTPPDWPQHLTFPLVKTAQEIVPVEEIWVARMVGWSKAMARAEVKKGTVDWSPPPC